MLNALGKIANKFNIFLQRFIEIIWFLDYFLLNALRIKMKKHKHKFIKSCSQAQTEQV